MMTAPINPTTNNKDSNTNLLHTMMLCINVKDSTSSSTLTCKPPIDLAAIQQAIIDCQLALKKIMAWAAALPNLSHTTKSLAISYDKDNLPSPAL